MVIKTKMTRVSVENKKFTKELLICFLINLVFDNIDGFKLNEEQSENVQNQETTNNENNSKKNDDYLVVDNLEEESEINAYEDEATTEKSKEEL